jgi:hypothetical protein
VKQFERESPEYVLFHSFFKHNIQFIIVGLSSAVIQGAHVSTQDVDLWIKGLGSENFVTAMKEAGGFYIPPSQMGYNPPLIGPDEKFGIFDLVVKMNGLEDFDSEYQNCKVVELCDLPVRILPLERIIVSKKAANRQKDNAVIPQLEATILVNKNRTKI